MVKGVMLKHNLLVPRSLDIESTDPQNWENWQDWNMHHPLISHRVVLGLVVTTILLPITICVVIGVGALLEGMGDVAGGTALHRIALGCGIVWVIDLICLLLVLAIGTLRGPDEPDRPHA